MQKTFYMWRHALEKFFVTPYDALRLYDGFKVIKKSLIIDDRS